MTENHDTHGARIRAARAYAGIPSQKELGERIGVGREVVLALEADQREPKVPELRRIADATGAPLDFLLNGWDGQRLEDRVAALEERVSSADQDRDDLVTRIDELDASLERRFERIAVEVLRRRRSQRRQEDHPGGEPPPTP